MTDEAKAVTEAAKAVQEVAKTTGQVVGASRELGGFVARFINGPFEQASGIVEDKLKYLRWERQQRLMVRANQFMQEIGLAHPTRPVPLKVAVPLLQGASIEEDDYLQDMFAKLLVNAADADRGVDVSRTYVDIISSIGSLEARILQTIYALPLDRVTEGGVATRDLPQSASWAAPSGKTRPPEPSTDVGLALANLIRLGCLKHLSTWGGGETLRGVLPTLLGKSFVEACTLRGQGPK